MNIDQVYDALKTVYDPEIPLSIVDLGLIYDVKADNGNVYVKMTLTSRGCGMGPKIAAQAQEAVTGISGVKQAYVEIVWEPQMDAGNDECGGQEKARLFLTVIHAHPRNR